MVRAGNIGNKHKNCVRIKHPESGVIVTGQEERSLNQNLKTAFTRLVNHPKFKTWLRIKIAEKCVDKEAERKELEKKVEESMKPENLKIEYFESL